MQKYLNIVEAAERIGVSRYILREEMKRGKLLGLKVGRRVLVPETALETYLKDCEIQPTKKPEKKSCGTVKCVPGMKIQLDGSVTYPDGSVRLPDGQMVRPKDAKGKRRA